MHGRADRRSASCVSAAVIEHGRPRRCRRARSQRGSHYAAQQPHDLRIIPRGQPRASHRPGRRSEVALRIAFEQPERDVDICRASSHRWDDPSARPRTAPARSGVGQMTRQPRGRRRACNLGKPVARGMGMRRARNAARRNARTDGSPRISAVDPSMAVARSPSNWTTPR